MAGNISLTEGAIATLLSGGTFATPILQILGIKKIPGSSGPNSPERYRMLVSDGKNSCSFAMLGTQLNEKVASEEIDGFCIMQVDKHICNHISDDKRVMIILEATILKKGSLVGCKIGNPIPCVSGTSSVGQPLQPSASNQTSKDNKSFENPEPKRMRPMSMGSNTRNVFPIESLTPYQNRWTIRARVTSKSSIRTWSNSRGDGKLFNVNFTDESGEIRATAFNDQCDKFFDLLEVDKVYYVSNANLKQANKNFSNVNNNYELTFRNDTSIETCSDCDNVPSLRFEFVPISEIQSKTKDSFLDVIGVCKSNGDLQTITARATNKEFSKREIQLVDQTQTEINLTLWGTDAENFDGHSNPVVAAKGAKVSDFGGCSLSLTSSSSLHVNLDIKEAHVLRGWYDKNGESSSFQTLSIPGAGSKTGGDEWKCLAQVAMENLGMGDKPDYYCCYATIILINKEKCLYQACTSSGCNKKVIDMNNGMYRCEKCNKETSDFNWRLMLSVHISDFTSNKWITCFQETAETILGITAVELGELRESDEPAYQAILAAANFKTYQLKLRTKMDSFNDENHLKTTCVSATPINYIERNKKLISIMKK